MTRLALLGAALLLAGCGPLPGYSQAPLLDRAAGPSLPDYRGNGGMGPGGVNGGMGDIGGIQGGGGPALP